jgi:hypothetical protein
VFTARVIPMGLPGSDEKTESRIEIGTKTKGVIAVDDLTSEDGDHGYQIDGAAWTPDAQFFVARMRSSGGHSPMYAPILIWKRATKRFYILRDYTGDMEFVVRAPDRLTVGRWPEMTTATLSLRKLKPEELVEEGK